MIYHQKQHFLRIFKREQLGSVIPQPTAVIIEEIFWDQISFRIDPYLMIN